MKALKEVEVIAKAEGILGVDSYFSEIESLISDIEFFKLFMKRNITNKNFSFDVRISYRHSYDLFDFIWKRHGYYSKKDTIELVLSEIVCLEYMANTIYQSDETPISEADKQFFKQFTLYLEQYNSYEKEPILTEKLATNFIGCSHGAAFVESEILKIKRED